MFKQSADRKGNFSVKDVETTFHRHEGRYSSDSGQGIMPFITFSLDFSSIKGQNWSLTTTSQVEESQPIGAFLARI